VVADVHFLQKVIKNIFFKVALIGALLIFFTRYLCVQSSVLHMFPF